MKYINTRPLVNRRHWMLHPGSRRKVRHTMQERSRNALKPVQQDEGALKI